MSIYKHAVIDHGDGNSFSITNELIEVRCFDCEGEAKPQRCPMDGARHHHGCIHTPDDGLQALCDSCYQKRYQS